MLLRYIEICNHVQPEREPQYSTTCSLTQQHRYINTDTDVNNGNIKINYISATFMPVMMMTFPKPNHVRHSWHRQT